MVNILQQFTKQWKLSYFFQEKWILCEAVSNEDTPVPLKYQTSHSLINNGTQTASSKEMTLYSCNGNGHTSNGQLRQIQDASTQINFIAEPKTKT